jgi:16S rRNA (guanine527-N7)-methyltransferase
VSPDAERGRTWLAENLACDGVALDRLERFVALLLTENRAQNLIAAATASEVWWRHVVDSAQLLRVSRVTLLGSGAWLDLGTGAGFPGIVIAALEPHREMVLVEERRLRAEWLRKAVHELALEHVRVEGVALRKLPPLPAAVISARAFAPLTKLLETAAIFSTRDTLWLLPKGAKARQEVDDLPPPLRSMFHVEPSATSPTGGIVIGRGQVPLATGVRQC